MIVDLKDRYPFNVPYKMSNIQVLSVISGNILAVQILPSVPTVATRRAFHLAMVLDVSGSMDGERLNSLRRTLSLLIERLSDDDTVSLISYNHESVVHANAVRIGDDRAGLQSKLDALSALGGTNMEAGLMSLRDLASVPDAVFVLTDGQINAGITSTTGLSRIVNSVVPEGTPINTLGYGADHNVRLLRDIAVRSRGTYTYADVAEILPAIIGDITAGLSSEVARGAYINVPAGWKCLELCADESAIRFSIGTLIDQKPQWVIFERTADAVDPDDVTVHYNGGSVTASVSAVIRANEIAEQYARVRVANVFTAVTENLENGTITEARTLLTNLGAELDGSVAKDSPLVIRLRAQIDEMIESLTHTPAYDHRGPGLPRSPFGGAHGLPPLGPTYSRLVSNTVSLGLQRGVVSTASEVDNTFSSPHMRQISGGLTATYSAGAAVSEDNDTF